jgi:TonB-linked SusC/RagA family outer membrane protein
MIKQKFFINNKLRKIFITACICILTLSLHAQNVTVRGTVTGTDGEILQGVSIAVKGGSSGVISDAAGGYSISVAGKDAVLVFSFVGFVTQEIAVGGRTELNVKMVDETQTLDELVVVGYGTQRRSTLAGSVSSIKADQLVIAPVGNVTNALSGKLPGLVTVQSSGMPGEDQASLIIRGFGGLVNTDDFINPLIIVDGVEASMTDLDASQIESVSILKDGAASIYGARAGNGVILVTTKRGLSQKPTVMLNSSYTLQGATQLAKTLSAGQYTQLARESHLNAGNPEETAPYTAEEVAKYMAGNDPAYQSSDWYGYTMRDWAPQQNHNLSLRGGTEKLKYLGFFGYQKQETMIKKNGGNYTRFNLQSNVDADITSRLKLSVDLMAAYENRKFTTAVKYKWFWPYLYGSSPLLPTEFPDPTKLADGGIETGSVYMATNMDIYGYRLERDRDLRGSMTLSYDVPYIEGLKLRAFVNYRDWQVESKVFEKPYEWYRYNFASGIYTQTGFHGEKANLSESITFRRQLTQQYSLNYDRTFGEDHHVTALAMLESIDYSENGFWGERKDFLTPLIDQMFAGSADYQSIDGSASEWGRASAIGRLNYSYRDKYLLEAILRADASAKFSEKTRWGYFPGLLLGWVISKEGFMENTDLIESLKLRASYGSSGYDGVADFLYMGGFSVGGKHQWGDRVVTGLWPSSLPNAVLTWEEMKIYNVGLDFSLLKRAVYGTVEGFYRKREGIPGTRINSLPSTFGGSLPTENINSLNNRGFELSLGTSNTAGDLMYDISANISWSRAKWDHYEEPEYGDPDEKRQNIKSGLWTDRMFGYVSDGVFTSQEEINALPYTYDFLGGTNERLRPGDVKLLDINGDGTVDWKDRQEIGKGSTPHWYYGMTAFLAYRGFDLTALFQGAFGYSTSVGYRGDISYRLRWTEENNHKDVLVPRPGGVSGGGDSDYLLRPTSYLRLKNASLGYTLPKKWTDRIGIQKARIHVSGNNLITFSTLNKFYMDPEAPGGGAYWPQQRTISLGVNLTF